MFKYKKGLFRSLLMGLIFFSSLSEATVPNAPGNYVGISKLSNTSVRISTRDNSDNEDKFYVYVHPHDAMQLAVFPPLTQIIVEINASDNRYMYANVKGLTCDKTYDVFIMAKNSDGYSSPTPKFTFNIESTFNTKCPTDKPLAPEPYIGVTDINKSAVRVNFLDNSDNEDGFLLFDDSGDINITVPKNNTTAPSQTYVTLDNLICNKTYNIKVLAFNSNGYSETSDTRAFNIKSTFSTPCPSVELSSYPNKIILRTSGQSIWDEYGSLYPVNINTTLNNFDNPIVSCKWQLDDNLVKSTSCDDVKTNSFNLNNWVYISPSDVLENKKHKITLIVTDSNGVSATDSIPVQFIDDGSDSIYTYSGSRITLKVGETFLIPAYVENIIPQHFCHSTVQGHTWVDSNNLGTFDDSMFETGHIICYGYRASTSYTANKKGNTILKLFANGGEKDINITIVEPNYTKDSIKKITVDNITGLMWQDNNTVKKTWTDGSEYSDDTSGDTATTYCSNLNWGGYNDWRIPNINELLTYISVSDDEEYWASTEGTSLSNRYVAVTTSRFQFYSDDLKLLVKCVRNIQH